MFFNSADALVSADTNGKEDVYEYEPEGVGSCKDSAGCTGLISSGTSGRESAFLDASQSGEDVFFLTASPLVAADTDRSIDIYDAHVCSQGSPCLNYPVSSSPQCESAATCRPSSPGLQPEDIPVSATYSGPGNPAVTAQRTVAAAKTVKPVPRPTRAQKLAKALKACRGQHRHSKSKRARCEREARRKYGSHAGKARKATPAARGRRRG